MRRGPRVSRRQLEEPIVRSTGGRPWQSASRYSSAPRRVPSSSRVTPIGGIGASRGPFCETWPIHHLTWDASPRCAAGAAAETPGTGPSVWRSTDMGETWTQSSEGLTYGDDGPEDPDGLERDRQRRPAIYAGVEPAGLFRSDDGGLTWSHVAGLREHPSRPEWQPGAGGLCLHSIAPHPTDPDRLWVGISAVGAFETDDGGATWETAQQGRARRTSCRSRSPSSGQCVHKLRLHPAAPGDALPAEPLRCVSLRRTAGARGPRSPPGLPSEFGFPMVIHPHDPTTVYVDPAQRRRQGPVRAGWSAGRVAQPRRGRLVGAARRGVSRRTTPIVAVLREAMSADRLDPAGIYFGTSTGQLFASADEGDGVAADRRLPAADLVGRDDHARRLKGRPGTREGRDSRLGCRGDRAPARSLVVLFPRRATKRQLEVDAPDVKALLRALDERWPGMWDRVCEPGPRIREHINLFVDGERSTIDTPLAPDLGRARHPGGRRGLRSARGRRPRAVAYPFDAGSVSATAPSTGQLTGSGRMRATGTPRPAGSRARQPEGACASSIALSGTRPPRPGEGWMRLRPS